MYMMFSIRQNMGWYVEVMEESMKLEKLDKQGLFVDYIKRYEYKNISRAYMDFEEIFRILEVISYAIQINRFNGHPRGDLNDEVVSMFTILCEEGVIDSYPFEYYDRYSSFSPQLKGD